MGHSLQRCCETGEPWPLVAWSAVGTVVWLQGCTDKRVMAFFRALRTAALADMLEETARSDGTPAPGAVTAPLTNAVEQKRQEALLRRSEHEWLGDCAAPAVRHSSGLDHILLRHRLQPVVALLPKADTAGVTC